MKRIIGTLVLTMLLGGGSSAWAVLQDGAPVFAKNLFAEFGELGVLRAGRISDIAQAGAHRTWIAT